MKDDGGVRMSADLRSRLESVLEDYESARIASSTTTVDRFAPAASDPDYAAIMLELLRAEMEFAFAEETPLTVAEYQRRYPELLGDEQIREPLAFEEYRLRQQAGQTPDPDEFRQRYAVDTQGWPRWQDSADSSEPPPTSGEFPAVGDAFAEFQLTAELGRGSLARAYLATQTQLANRPVVLKISSQVDHEPQTLAQLQHSHIVSLYSLHQVGPWQAVCMPFLGATTLADVLHASGSAGLGATGQTVISTVKARNASTVAPLADALPDCSADSTSEISTTQRHAHEGQALDQLQSLDNEAAAVWIMARVSDGLAYAHEHGVLHRDLKPANILIADDGEPLILDFNLAADSQGDPQRHLGGTLPYMAPEHLQALQNSERASSEVDERSDIYGLGVILFEFLTGKPPFPVRQGHWRRITSKMLEDRRGPAPSVRQQNPRLSVDIDTIVARCLAPNPDQRYASARQLETDLKRHQADLPLQFAPNRSLAQRCRKWARRHPRISSSGAVALVAGAAIIGLVAWLSIWNQRLTMANARQHVNDLLIEAQPLRVELAAARVDHDALQRAFIQGNDWLELSAPTVDRLSRQAGGAWAARTDRSLGELQFLMASAAGQLSVSAVESRRREQWAAQAQQLHAAASQRLGSQRRSVQAQRQLLARLGPAQGDEDGRDGSANGNLAFAGSESNQNRLAAENGGSLLPEDAFLHVLALRDQGQSELAWRELEQVLPLAPSDFAYWFEAGVLQADLNRLPQAEAAFSVCLSLKADSYWAWLYRGVTRLQLRDAAGAQQDLEEAVRLRPGDAWAMLNLALVKREQGQTAAAEKYCSAAIETGRAPTRAYLVRSRLRQTLGNTAGAAADFQLAMERTPGDELSWVARGAARAASQPQLALEDFRQALRLNPRSGTALQNCAAILALRPETTAEAITMMNRLVELEQENATHWATRGVLFARQGNREQALRNALEALRLKRDADTQYRVAGVYALLSVEHPEDRPEAVRLLQNAAWQAPSLVALLVGRDADLKPLTDDADFQALTQRLAVLKPPASRP